MKKEFNERRLVKVYLEEADYKWVELQASGNVSGWCREIILGAMPEQSGTDTPVVREGRVSRKAERQAETTNAERRVAEPPKSRDMADYSVSENPSITRNICANCDHPKSKHGGFKSACQADVCRCEGYQ